MTTSAHRPANEPSAFNGGEEMVWVERAVAGDRAAFERIYRAHQDRVYGLCLRLTGDRSEAETLVQDTFVKAWFALAGFSGQGSLGGWLARVATNRWRDKYRARLRRRDLAAAAAAEGADVPRSEAVVPLLTAMDLERAIEKLPAGARQVFVLYELEGRSQAEIAELLGVAVGTVKGQLHRARGLLRAFLAPDKENTP